MKTFSALLVFLAITSYALAQDFKAPKSGAAVKMKESSFHVKAGEQVNAQVYLVRSKSYRKATFGPLAANDAEGLEIVLQQDAANPDTYQLKVKARTNAPAGKKSVIIKGSGKNASKVKGLLIMVNIEGSEKVADSR